jgi:polyhydroxybutyrate depolymerase
VTARPETAPGTLVAEAVSLQAAGRARTMTVVRPPALAPGGPVVLVFHGSNQTGPAVRRFAGNSLDVFAQRDGAVVAYLDGYKRNWNDARLASKFPARKENIDDVAFTVAAVDYLAGHYGADASRVYVIGFSAGGAMVLRLLHEIPGRLSGAAVISATQPVPENFPRYTEPAVPVPVVLFHGTADRLVPYSGGMASLWGLFPRGLGQSAPQTAACYAARNGITAEPVTGPPGGAPAADGTEIERTDYRQAGHAPVTLYTVRGGGHVIPGPGKAPRIMGRTTRRLVAADAIEEFFGL